MCMFKMAFKYPGKEMLTFRFASTKFSTRKNYKSYGNTATTVYWTVIPTKILQIDPMLPFSFATNIETEAEQ